MRLPGGLAGLNVLENKKYHAVPCLMSLGSGIGLTTDSETSAKSMISTTSAGSTGGGLIASLPGRSSSVDTRP